MRVALHLDEALGGLPFLGATLAGHWAVLLEQAGLELASEGGPPARLHLDGRFAGVAPATLARLGPHTPLLRAPDGTVVACLGHGGLQAPASTEGVVLSEDEALDVSRPHLVAAAEARIRARWARALSRNGVRVVDPDRVLLDLHARVEPGVTLWPDVVLRGRTHLRAGAEVRPGCWLEDTTVGEGALVKPHTVCEGAFIGPGCQVGPMAHLRPGARLEGENKVGNFVEVKKATLEAGAKASHLTYLGDARVGAGANVGAGTITCNYDGHRKHRTDIGAGAFIGSNTALVAPVRIGDGAIVGAGSVVTRDVPAEALAVERGSFKVLEGKGRALNERNARLKAQEAAARSEEG
jgi:UDP-N-acetylglucosamine diphosphorylase/glucosamine-1-phosphate N-acetyltransferase